MPDIEPIRILQIVPNMHRAGLETLLMNIYRNISRTNIQFDFLVHYSERFDYDEEIERLGGHIYRFSVREDNDYIKYIYQLKTFFKNHQEYKIVHGHMESFGFIYSKIAKEFGVKTIIAHSHNASVEPTLKGKIKGILNKKWGKYVTDFFACSTEAGKYMFPGKKFILIKNGIEAPLFDFSVSSRQKIRKQYHIPDKAILLGHIGRMEKQKNQLFLIDVFEKYHTLNSNSYLMILGDGTKKKELMDYISKHTGLINYIICPGVQSNCNEYYSAFDIFLLPSLFEGLPVVGIEAQCSGLPIIFSNNISKETDVTGLIEYLPIDSPILWAERISTIMANNGRKGHVQDIVASGFDISTTCSFLTKFYMEKYYENTSH